MVFVLSIRKIYETTRPARFEWEDIVIPGADNSTANIVRSHAEWSTLWRSVL